MRLFALVCVVTLAVACAGQEPGSQRDPHSFSHPGQAVVRHLSLDLDVDFDARQLSGTATLTIENLTGTDELRLDAWDLDVT